MRKSTSANIVSAGSAPPRAAADAAIVWATMEPISSATTLRGAYIVAVRLPSASTAIGSTMAL